LQEHSHPDVPAWQMNKSPSSEKQAQRDAGEIDAGDAMVEYFAVENAPAKARIEG